MANRATSLRRNLILGLLEQAKGRFVTIDFVKKDGTLRRMNVQPDAVITHTTGCSTPAQARAVATRRKNHPNLYPVFDVAARRIKSVNLDTVSRVAVDGNVVVLA